MDSIGVEATGEGVPGPVDLVRYCRQQIETSVPVLDSQRRSSPLNFAAASTSGHPSVGSTAEMNDHRLRLLASATDSTCANTVLSPPSLSGLSSSIDSSEMYQGGLFNPKSTHLSPFVDDFRPNRQYQKSNVWCYQPAANAGGDPTSDLSFFSDGPSSLTADDRENGLSSGANGGKKTASDKTPMCLIADLARYNDVPHQYKLINEGGPAHQKIFTVSLTVGNGSNQEEYTAQGASIKKAQQAAAQKALEETKMPKRPPRFSHKRRPTATTYGYCSMENGSLTPTVMLNALAMKIGATPEYTFLNSPFPVFPRRPPIPPPSVFHGNPLRFFRGGPPFSSPPPAPPFAPFAYPPPLPFVRFPPVLGHYVKLSVGEYEFVGQGQNRQLAKHDASLKALRALEPLVQKREQQEKAKRLSSKSGQESQEEPAAPPEGSVAAEQEQTEEAEETAGNSGGENAPAENKSPINMVYEFALRRHMDVNFEVISETGPAHKRHFVVRCVVTCPSLPPLTTDGEGASKKLAKHDAAGKMMQKLKLTDETLPPPMTLRQQHEQQAQQRALKEKRRKATIVKDLKSDPSYGQEINPVSRLIQVQQAKNEPEPAFEFVGEDGHARCKEFIMKATIGEKSCEGRGPNKKLAKRAAAEAMLEMMGYAKPLPTPGKPVLKHRQSPPSESSPDGHGRGTSEELAASQHVGDEDQAVSNSTSEKRKVKFQLNDDAKRDGSFDDDDENRSSHYRFGRQRSRGRRLAPGLFFLPSAFADCDTFDDSRTTTSPADGEAVGQPQMESSFGTWNEMQTVTSPSSPPATDGAREQLGYLANLLSFQVQFTDFPKSLRNGENGEFLSLVSLSTVPPLVCHGSGPTIQQAQNEASLAALRSLAGKGLETAMEGECSLTRASAPAVEETMASSASQPVDGGDSAGE